MKDFENNFHLLDDPLYLLSNYNEYLFGKGKVLAFKIGGSIKNGIIQKVEEDGLLEVRIENKGIMKFRIKEIEFLY